MKPKWMILVACACLTACSTQASTVTPTADLPVPSVSPTADESEELPAETPQAEETEVVIYEVISPETINTEGGFEIRFNGAID